MLFVFPSSSSVFFFLENLFCIIFFLNEMNKYLQPKSIYCCLCETFVGELLSGIKAAVTARDGENSKVLMRWCNLNSMVGKSVEKKEYGDDLNGRQNRHDVGSRESE